VARLSKSLRDGAARSILFPDQPLHVIQRGNDRQAVFFTQDNYAVIATGCAGRPANTDAPFISSFNPVRANMVAHLRDYPWP